MLKNILIFSCLSFVLLYADSFEFTSIKRDSSGAINDSGLKVANEKEIIATGYGTTQQQALDNAFKSAIEQYVGVLVDAETMMKNGKLIKDKILTASNGFIKNYKELSVDNSDGLIEVKINALVKSQKIFNKIKSLNIATISINDTQDIHKRITTKIKNKQAEKTTKIKAKKDAEKILKKAIDDFFSNQSLQDMLNITITDVKIYEERVKGNKVPMKISYTLELDDKVYLQKVRQLEQVFENLGAKLHKRVDLPYLDGSWLKIKNYEKVGKLTSTDFGIIKKYGQGYKLDIWEFPREWKDIYPFYAGKEINWKNIFQIILELKNDEGEIILADNITPHINYVDMITFHTSPMYNGRYQASYRGNTNKIIYPAFAKKVDSLTYVKSSENFTSSQMVDINNINNLKNITIELEEK